MDRSAVVTEVLMVKSTSILFGLIFLLASARAGDTERAFFAGNARVMDRMMKDMTVKPSGDVDADFVNMMEPHHRGAIDMAVLELRYGRNEQLRRIAQEIIVDQQQEIDAMRLALGRKLSRPAPAPTTSSSYQPMTGMTPPH